MSNNTIQEYQQLKSEAGELLSAFGESLITLVEAPADDAHLAIDEQIQRFFNAYYNLRKRHDRQTLSVAVLALTKSGKSTLINAFLGNEILPVNNVPETARISRIVHSPSSETPEPILSLKELQRRPSASCSINPGSPSSSSSVDPYDLARAGSGASTSSSTDVPVTVLVGAQQIREHLQQLNRDVRSREHMRNDEQVLDITAPLVVLDDTTTVDYAGIKLCLLDTPGPNEAGEEGLKYQVERLLDRVDAAIYLLDYTKLKTAEEAAVLGRLKTINPCLVARLCSRLFFAVNKMDQADESCGLDEEETKQYVAEMVTRQLNCPDFKLHPDQVLLLSARNALLSRLVLSGRADQPNAQRFSRIAFGSFNPRSNGAGSSSNNTICGRPAELVRSAAADMLESSGVPELEERVLGFLFEAAAGVKLVAILDDMGRLLTEVSNVAASCQGALAASSARLAASTAALQSELDATLSQFDGVMEGTQELQVEVVDELRAHLGNLRTRLFQFICSSLDAEALRQSADAASAASAAAASEAEAAEAGGSSSSSGHRHRRHRAGCCHARHRRHRHRSHGNAAAAASDGDCAAAAAAAASCGASEYDESCCMYEDDPSFTAAAAASSSSSAGRGWSKLRQRFVRLFGGWLRGGCQSKDELSSALIDLSEEIMAQVQSEVSDTWAVMERATNARAGRLVTSLNTALEGLGARLEGVVAEGLQIRLEPVSLALAAPDACQFHADLTQLIDKGIASEQARHVRSSERVDMVWEARRGVCRLTPYYVQVPRRRRIVETYTATTYSLVPDAVAEHFMGVVDDAISTTERQLAGYVKEYVRAQVAAARDKVKEYGDRYLDSMGAALEAASHGADARAAALAQVEAYCATLESLRARLAGLQARAELLVPHNSGSGVGVFEQVDYVMSDDEGEGEEGQRAVEEGDGSSTPSPAAAAAADVVLEEVQLQQAVAGDAGLAAAAVGIAVAVPSAVAAIQETVAAAEEAAAAAADSNESSGLQQGEQQVEEALVGEVRDLHASGSDGSMSAAAAEEEEEEEEEASISTADLLGLPQEPQEEEEQQQQQQQQRMNLEEWLRQATAAEQATAAATATAAAAATTDIAHVDAAVAGADTDDAEQQSGAEPAEEPVAGGGGDSRSLTGLSRVNSNSSSSSSAQLLSAEEVVEAQQAEAAAAGVLLMASLPQQQQQQGVMEEGEGVDAAAAVAYADGGSAPAAAAAMSEDRQPEVAQDVQVAAAAAAGGGGGGSVKGQRADDEDDDEDGIPELVSSEVLADDYTLTSAAAGGFALSVDDIVGGLPVTAAAAPAAAVVAAEPADSNSSHFLLDENSIAGAQLLPEAGLAAAAAAAAPSGSSSSSSGVLVSAAGSSAAASPSASSAASTAETPLSGSVHSAFSAAATDSTTFSGMTAGTGFTLGSSTTQGSQFSRVQEQLANSVLSGSGMLAAPAAAAAAAAGGVTPGESSAANAGDSAPAAAAGGSLAPINTTGAGSSSVFGSSSAVFGGSSGMAGTSASPFSAAAAAAAPAAPAETAATAELDASMYASIIAHSDDNPTGEGTPGSGGSYEFRQSFAAALSAAGLDNLTGRSRPSSLESGGSDDWMIVDGVDEGQQQ